MYTLETLIPDCVGRYITSPATGAVQLASLINGRTYAKCWQALVYWVVNQYDIGNSTNLSPLGIIVRKEEGDGKPKTASFLFLRSFLEKYGIEGKGGDVIEMEDEVSSIKMNLSTVSKLADVQPQTFRKAMSHLFRRLGEVLGNKEQVLIDCNIGTIVGDKGIVEFIFHEGAEQKKSDATAVDPRLLSKSSKTGQRTGNLEVRNLRSKYPILSPARSPKSFNFEEKETDVSPAPTEALPNASTGQFRRVLQGTAPLKRVRQGIEFKKIDPDKAIDYMVEEAKEEKDAAELYSSSSLKGKYPKLGGLVGSSLPPVLDSFQRTQAATYSSETYYASVSAKIACFYTPEACQYTIDPKTGTLVSTKFLPFAMDRYVKSDLEKTHERRAKAKRSDAEKSMEERGTTKSLLCYQHYMEQGIEDSNLASIKEEWIRNALGLLCTNISLLSEETFEEIIRSMLSEMNNDYKASMKQSIIDYVLMNTTEQTRLSIQMPPPKPYSDWGMGKKIESPPFGVETSHTARV